MASPKLEIQRRQDRLENAISTMVDRLEQSTTGLTSEDVSDIKKILRGEDEK
jgi:hypothetical protein